MNSRYFLMSGSENISLAIPHANLKSVSESELLHIVGHIRLIQRNAQEMAMNEVECS